ncbi:hypothetical protein [Streptococcus fryi]
MEVHKATIIYQGLLVINRMKDLEITTAEYLLVVVGKVDKATELYGVVRLEDKVSVMVDFSDFIKSIHG